MRKRILPFIMVMLMIFTALPISASASTLYYGKTINSGETYTDTSFEILTVPLFVKVSFPYQHHISNEVSVYVSPELIVLP